MCVLNVHHDVVYKCADCWCDIQIYVETFQTVLVFVQFRQSSGGADLYWDLL